MSDNPAGSLNPPSREEILLMIKEEMGPFVRDVDIIKNQVLRAFGDGNTSNGEIGRMEEKQDKRWDQQMKRWDQQLRWNLLLLKKIGKAKSDSDSHEAVHKDRRWMISTFIVAVPTIIAIIDELKHMLK